ncbi:MAG: Fe-Mn family superoxide dismutase [Pseudomonadota bacterium]
MAISSSQFSFEDAAHFVRPIPFKAHRIDGFSPETVEHHYEEIYGGEVRRLNDVERRLASLSATDQRTSAFADLKKEEQRLTNAIALHEIYFNGLGEDGGEDLSNPALASALDAAFGGEEAWKNDFMQLVRAWPGGAGWIVLAWSESLGRLVSAMLADDEGLNGANPVFALNMSDDAYSADFGDDRVSYADAVLKSLHWGRIAAQFQKSFQGEPRDEPDQISVKELKARIEDNDTSLVVLDVRHDDDRVRYTSRIMETEWRDSFDVASWAGTCPKDKLIVVYCMYGFWVSQKVAEELRGKGFDTRSLEGGIAAWRAMGLPTTEISD